MQIERKTMLWLYSIRHEKTTIEKERFKLMNYGYFGDTRSIVLQLIDVLQKQDWLTLNVCTEEIEITDFGKNALKKWLTCQSCNMILEQPKEYCPHCGIKMNLIF